MYKYTLAVTSAEYWNTIHNVLIVDSNEDGIPDRKVDCSDTKEHSPTRGTYWLTHEEATGISTHPQVKWIELSPSDYREVYPDPEPATKRFRKDVKIYRDLSGSNAPPGIATAGEANRTNWALRRVGLATNGDGWPNVVNSAAPTFSDIKYSLTGKNVDLVIQDSGVLQYHPEFIGDDGKSRVRDIILDGPYYIDPSYFTSNSYTYTKPDGRIGITTASAHSWWENSSNRSGSFSSVGTVAIPDSYTVANSLGIGGTSHTMTSSHGTGCAGLAAGKNFGLAFESNIWTISIFSPASQSVERSYDCMKIFHQNKPINTATGRKNPTVVNGSWGYYAGFNSGTQVYYSWKGATGNFTGYASNSTGVQAYAYGISSGSVYNRQYSTSSRSNSTETAGDEMIAAGVVFVGASGNNNQRVGVGSDDAHINDYFTTLNSADGRSGIPGADSGGSTCPSGHRNFIHPGNIGFNTISDFHPSINVGALDDVINDSYDGTRWASYSEMKVSYSNNGPGIDVFAPADETLSAGMRAANGDGLPNETNYARYNSNFVDRYFNGTSAASPVVCGLVALFLESNPTASCADAKNFILTHGSAGITTDKFWDVFATDDNQYYWSGNNNLRGAATRIAFDPFASDTRPTFAGVFGGENIITSGLVLNLDGNNYTSGTTWTDTSGQGNNGTLTNGPTFDSANGGSIVFDGTNDYVQFSSDMFNPNADFTISSWVNLDTASGTNNYTIVSDFNFTGSIQLRYKNGTGVQIIDNNIVNVGTFASSSLSTTTWYNVTVTRSSNTYTLYLNGSSTSSFTSSNTYDGGARSIGINKYNSEKWDGKIAQVLAYNTALSDSDVKHNYDAMKGRYLDQPLTFSGISFSLT